MVLAVLIAGVAVAQTAFAGVRLHAAVVRISYTLAAASDEATRIRAANAIANAACTQPRIHWRTDTVAGIPMVEARLACQTLSVMGASKQMSVVAHAPIEMP
jgi:hypothetical protein